MRQMYTEPQRPLSAFQVKKKYEEIEKKVDEDKNFYHFRVRALDDERLLGFGEVHWILWSNGIGHLRLGIGDPADWRKGYGRETLALLLRYAFDELNLYRLSAVIPEYNTAALALFAKAGFIEEVRRREALARDGRRWDLLNLGLLTTEWRESHA
jgi:RimJ/RimL family protein N-acetyltransferase